MKKFNFNFNFIDESEGLRPLDPYRQVGISGDTIKIYNDLVSTVPNSIAKSFTTLDYEDHDFRMYTTEEEPTKIKIRKSVSKLLRLKLVKERGGICEICKNEVFDQIHHIDGDASNNDEYNLRLICITCHKEVHNRRTTK